MALTRRFFLGSCASLAAASGCRSFGIGSGAPRLKLGVLSDIHLNYPGDEDTFLASLEYFRSRRVDGVLIAGDIADQGRVSQLKRCADVWFKVFPDGKYADGKVCEQLFVYGNHCILGCDWGCNKDLPDEELLGRGDTRKIAWEKFFHEEYQPIWLKKVNGCPIIGAHWVQKPNWRCSWDDGAVTEFLEAHKSAIDPSLPFVYTQHSHPKDTCMGPWAWGHDHGAVTDILSKFPNAVAFSGHSHYSLTDERSVWQGAFTSINTSSLRYVSTEYSMRENGIPNACGYQDIPGRKRVMDRLPVNDGRQGMVVSFYDSEILVERFDFVGMRRLGPDWSVPFPAGRDDYSFGVRSARRSAPEFSAGAAVTVETREKDGRRFADVRFTAAESVDGCRPFDYEVTAILVEDDFDLVQAQRRVLDAGYYMPESAPVRETVCTFDLAELPRKGHYRFAVRPIECFGKKGRAIESGIIELA